MKKRILPLLLLLLLLLTSCSFPKKIADIPKADDVSRIRMTFAVHDPANARCKDFTEPEDIRTILYLLSGVDLQYESTGTQYGGSSCTITCYKWHETEQTFAFSETFDSYSVWKNEDTVYYTVLSGGAALAEFYENADAVEKYKLPQRS